MKIGALSIEMSCESSGYVRGYYEIDETAIEKCVNEYKESHPDFDEYDRNHINALKEYIKDNEYSFTKEFISVRDDMEREFRVTIR